MKDKGQVFLRLIFYQMNRYGKQLYFLHAHYNKTFFR